MAKKGMKRPELKHKNSNFYVPEIQGKAKYGNIQANPIIEDTHTRALKVYHSKPYSMESVDRPISDVYPVIDNDLARDNIENDITAADLQDL